ncbi:MAG: undecaprenyl-diphosphatase UppP [Anaerolineales bacterium]
MSFFQAILLGIVQGLTEFIPVSSTAHLLISQRLLGLPASDAMFAFLVLVQWGTLLSLFIFYWRDFWNILLALTAAVRAKRGAPLAVDAQLGLYILLATLPALAAGFLLKDAVQALFAAPLLEAGIRLLTAALILALAEWLSRRTRPLESMTGLDALLIGLFQVIAVFPGASRSGVTISGGMLRGFSRTAAARFAFLMSAPVMLAAGAYELLKVVKMPGLMDFLPSLALGFVVAALTGWLAIRWLIGYLNRHSLWLFAAYCALLGAACLAANFWLG